MFKQTNTNEPITPMRYRERQVQNCFHMAEIKATNNCRATGSATE